MTYESPSPDTGPRVTRDEVRDISRLRRARDNKMVAGVAEGLSRHFDVDPLIIRVVFGALVLFGGAGLVLYLIAWVTIPEEGQHDSPLSSTLHRDPSRVMVAGLAVAAVVGTATMIGAIGFSAPNPFPVLLISVVAIAALAVFSRRSDRPVYPPPSVPPWQGAPYPPPAAMAAGAAAPTTAQGTAVDEPSADAEATTGEAAATGAGPSTATAAPPERAWWQRPDDTGSGMGGYPPPTAYAPPPPPPVHRPRSHLFAITMALVAIALGTLWILDATTFDDLSASAYPGTALAIIAGGLLVGTWFGRSRLLIFFGVVATLVTAASTFVGPGPYGERVYRPTAAAVVQPSYDHGTGRMVLHLEDISDPENLDGRLVDLDQRIGQLEVIVPSSLAVVINAHVDHGEIDGPQRSLVSDLDGGAEEITMSSVPDGGTPDLTLDLGLRFGQIRITQYDCPRAGSVQESTGLATTSTTGDFHAAAACN